MRFSDMIPVITAAVTGLFLLTGYVVQKTLEYRRTVAEKKRETYSMFIKSTFAAIEFRKSNRDFDPSEEIFWKAQISLYGSDEVIRKLGKLTALLPRIGESHGSSQDQLAVAFDELMLAMRQDITPNSHVILQDLRRISLLLMDRSPDAHHPPRP